LCYKTIDRVLGVIFLIELCILAIISIKIIQVWGGLSSLYTGLPHILFLFKFSLRYIIGFIVVILFFLNKPIIKWFLLIYVVLVLLINPLWNIQPNTHKYNAEVKKLENDSTTTESSIPTTVKLYIYPSMSIKIFFILALLYVFTLRLKLISKSNNLEAKTS